MATRLPRTQVTMDERTNSAVKRLASISNKSASKIISGLLSDCVEPMERLADILEDAKKKNNGLSDSAKEAFNLAADNLDRLEADSLTVMKDLSLAFKDGNSNPLIEGVDRPDEK